MRLLPIALAVALATAAQAAPRTAPPIDPAPPGEARPPVDTVPLAEAAPPKDGAPAAEPALATLETVVVTGIQPGPGLWQIRKGENTLWIMATVRPLPRRIEWEPRELDALVSRADRVLSPPRSGVVADIGFFGALRLLPSALRARNNPDEKTLADMLPPELYARWQAQKAKYMGRDRGVEERRPVFAADALMNEALEDLDLKYEDIVWDRVERIAKSNDREIVPVEVSITIDDPREALREFERGGVDDIRCMEATLNRLENDTGAMVERANAWAVGDLRTLEELELESELRACILSLLNVDAFKKRGLADLPQRVIAEWVRLAEESLAHHATTVAVADFGLLTAEDGLLATLRAKGYDVMAPGDEPVIEPTRQPVASRVAPREVRRGDTASHFHFPCAHLGHATL